MPTLVSSATRRPAPDRGVDAALWFAQKRRIIRKLRPVLAEIDRLRALDPAFDARDLLAGCHALQTQIAAAEPTP